VPFGLGGGIVSDRVLRVGAVAYDPRVVTIWEGFRDYFDEENVPTDYILFSNYEAQVEALVNRVIDVAWNTNVAYVRTEERVGGGCVLLGMRDADQVYTSRIVARADSGIASLEDLRGRRLAVGTADSGQASILPLHWIREAGLDPDTDVEVTRFELDMGKHGDTGTSELEVLKALHEGKADAGALGGPTWVKELESGHVNAQLVKSIWTSPEWYHCNFTALPDFDRDWGERWSKALLAMDFNDQRWRRFMELEGLQAWLPGSKEGYASLADALGLDRRLLA
jgi:ABC-type phosphate/phosphonate transport system substrate-binding protein